MLFESFSMSYKLKQKELVEIDDKYNSEAKRSKFDT